MLTSSYDVVIAGTDLPGLILGALAAKKGYRVLVLGHGGRETVYDLDGFRFVRRPNLMFGLTDSHPIREVFRELALAPEMRNLPRPLAPTCNVVLPDSRVEITHMKGILEEEINREFPGELEKFRDYLHRVNEVEKSIEPILKDCPILPPANISEFLAYRRARKEIASLLHNDDSDALEPFADNPKMRALFSAPLTALSGVTEPWRYPAPFIRLTANLFRGLYLVEWGLDSLKNLFIERIKGNSGNVRTADRIDMVIVKGGKVREIEIRARDEAIGVGCFVVGTDLAPVLDLIPEGNAKKRYRAKIAKVEPSHYMVTVNVGANRAIIPEGMARIAFVVRDPGKPLDGSNYLIIQTDPAMEPAEVRDPERTTISVSGFLRAAHFDNKPETIEAFSNELIEGLKELLPFLDRHLISVSTAAIGTDTRSGKPAVDVSGLVPIYPDIAKRSLDIVSRPIRTAYKNMLFLGDGTAGPLGFEGAFVSAFMAFSIMKKMIPKKNVI